MELHERDLQGPHSHHYDAVILTELPNSSDAFYEIPDPRRLSATSVLVRIAPHGAPRWIGRFRSREVVGNHRRGIYTTRDPYCVAVMVNASAVYWIDVRDPSRWKAPELGYLEDAIFDAQRDQVIVSIFDAVRAFDSDGTMLWEVCDAGFDGMRFSSIEGSTLRGIGDAFWSGEAVEFLIDVASGARIR